MSEALLLSLIHKLVISYGEGNSILKEKAINYEERFNKMMERVIKEMREIVDIVRDKKLEEGKTLKFLVSDLVDVADDALNFVNESMEHYYLRHYKSIHSWMGEIKKRILKLGDDESSMRSISENVEDDKYVVGLDEDVEFLLSKRILNGAKYRRIVIKGMSGIGKTTLAREIFNHPTVVERFERRAWVSNSTDLTIKELLIKVIQQVVVEDPQNLHTSDSSLLENMDNRSLRDMLSQHLLGKRYLIVLDDMPKQMRFKSFLKALPEHQDNGSRLLLTSHITHRDIKVHRVNVYKMNPLDSKKSWQLFMKTINHGNKLTGDHKFLISLEYMGKQMLRKCGGLPLAIKEVGKQLAEKKVSGESEWEQLLESVDFGSTLKLLELFYLQLDPELQSCFLSMAFFKENITFRAERLSHIALVRGIVDYAYNFESYLDDLINEVLHECCATHAFHPKSRGGIRF